MNTLESLYVPALEPKLKHSTVFKTFDALQTGDSFLLVNDHDPIPLFYEMKAERGETFEWKKVENGPDVWKVEITKTADSITSKESQPQQQEKKAGKEVLVLNVTLIEPRLKHPTIFQHFDALAADEAFQLLNDHDPKPLYYQLIAERGNNFTWKYLEKGPQWWRVQIAKNDPAKGETVGTIAAKDMRKAEVFKKYGIDFCCGGKKSLQQACEEANVPVAEVEAALTQAETKAANNNINFTNWDADFLSDYIYNQHHKYYYEEAPVITDLLIKVFNRHGAKHPELQPLYQLFMQLQEELNVHFLKEEKVIFPFIKALVKAKKTGDFSELKAQPSLTDPVHEMESDHEAAGDILAQMRQLTHQYITPPNACNSFQFLYKKLEALENDLHTHVHLENNVLFPKALAIEKELRK